MNDCTTVRPLLPAAVYDDLPPDQAAAVRRHLEACPHCEAAAARRVGLRIGAEIRKVRGADVVEERRPVVRHAGEEASTRAARARASR